MINQIVKRISTELEKFAKYNISIDRALDLIEASTRDLDELIAINTMRESLGELKNRPSALELSFTNFSTHPHVNQTDYYC